MKPSASFPKLTSAEASLPSMSAQADGFPEGWTIRHVPSGNASGGVMNMYYSPISNFRFIGIAAARRFLNCLDETGGNDEEAACHLFQKETSGVESSIKVKTECDQFGTAASTMDSNGKAASTAAVASSNNTAGRINTHVEVKEERKQKKSKFNQDETSRKPRITAIDESHIKFEADTDTVYDSDIQVIDDESGDKVGDNQ